MTTFHNTELMYDKYWKYRNNSFVFLNENFETIGATRRTIVLYWREFMWSSGDIDCFWSSTSVSRQLILMLFANLFVKFLVCQCFIIIIDHGINNTTQNIVHLITFIRCNTKSYPSASFFKYDTNDFVHITHIGPLPSCLL